MCSWRSFSWSRWMSLVKLVRTLRLERASFPPFDVDEVERKQERETRKHISIISLHLQERKIKLIYYSSLPSPKTRSLPPSSSFRTRPTNAKRNQSARRPFTPRLQFFSKSREKRGMEREITHPQPLNNPIVNRRRERLLLSGILDLACLCGDETSHFLTESEKTAV